MTKKNSKLKDLQNEKDKRKESIQKVGIKNLKYPIKVLINDEITHNLVGNFSISVNLKHFERGVHMSRFIEVLNENDLSICYTSILSLMHNIKKKLDSENVFIKVSFIYFIKKTAPISKVDSYLSYHISYYSRLIEKNNLCKIKIKIPVISCCPCSKNISKYGAHNQRSIISVELEINENLNINNLIKEIELQASCDIFSLIKRKDEKYITEKSYENAKFVEDIVRDISLLLKKKSIEKYKILSENIESIHDHTAYAYIER